MSLSREQMLVEMGISPIWVVREKGGEPAPAVAPAPQSAGEAPPSAVVAVPQPAPLRESVAGPAAAVDAMNWPELTRAVAECKACPLCQQRKQAVLGVGDLNPDWLFIGEGPGADEDVQGEPFVGQAGKLLDNMLASLDISRGNKVYIGNAVKCRPPGNRTPEAAEMAACRPYLERQIALLKPKIIVLLGKAAVHSVLHDDKSLASLRGKRFEYAGIPVVVTYHPAYLLRNLPDKSKAWEDLLFARRLLNALATPELPF
ncbi:uracil-DNA glycosylase [Azonexus sp. IMCC34842]|uniref:uracil-DNA glycosylase n=1 Tax=Azonexus sp. IMCC34842 TaxID=3420950 RepID=UPI003D119D43